MTPLISDALLPDMILVHKVSGMIFRTHDRDFRKPAMYSIQYILNNKHAYRYATDEETKRFIERELSYEPTPITITLA